MFDVYCPNHESRVLLWTSDIDSITNTDKGILVQYHCTCGHRGAWVTGSRSAQPVAA